MSVITFDRLGFELNRLVQNVGENGREHVGKMLQGLPYRAEAGAIAYYFKVLKIRTGSLRRSISGFSRRIGEANWEIGLRSDVNYAAIQEYGGTTKPHVIEPIQGSLDEFGGLVQGKQALFWPGANHPVRRVNHPGSRIKATHFLSVPLREAAAVALMELKKGISFNR